jgi:ubiquinone/menaquinone biosynthesis C-methylase UbiE
MKLVEILNEFNLDSDFLSRGYTEGGTDKNTYHSYIENFYEKEFEPYREKEIKLLEIGIETGGSLKLWKEYFLNSKSIVGIDITDEKIDNKYRNIDGVTMYFGDAYDKKFSDKFDQFDIIVDDGPHTLESQLKSIELYLPKLKKNGLFVIEDIQSPDWFSSLTNKCNEVYNSTNKQIEYRVECIDLRDKKGRWDDLLLLIRS